MVRFEVGACVAGADSDPTGPPAWLDRKVPQVAHAAALPQSVMDSARDAAPDAASHVDATRLAATGRSPQVVDAAGLAACAFVDWGFGDATADPDQQRVGIADYAARGAPAVS